MKKTTLLHITIATTLLSSTFISVAQEEHNNTHQTEEFFRIINRYSQPSNPNETPTTPKVIRHDRYQANHRGLKGRSNNIAHARIYFGTDESGKPSYRAIQDHIANNPAFGEVKLVILHEGSWLNPFSNDSFEHIGTIADESSREKLIESMIAENGILFRLKNGIFNRLEKDGLWCPKQNAFIGGTKNTCMCDIFEEFEKQQKPASKIAKI
jgi:hypothetical protein